MSILSFTLQTSLSQKIIGVWNAGIRPLFRVIDVLLKSQKCSSVRTLAKKLWLKQKVYWMNTVFLRRRLVKYYLEVYSSCYARAIIISVLVFISLSTFNHSLTLTRYMWCPLPLTNYWRSVILHCLETLKEQRAFWKQHWSPVELSNQSCAPCFIVWTCF